MKNNVVKVSIWGKTVGELSWDDSRGCSVFQFDGAFPQYGLDIAPLVAPLASPYVQRAFPMHGNKERLYAGLPEFISDSLPDRWGNVVFSKWCEAKHLTSKQISSVDRLLFIGKRAMGALEFEPAHVDDDASVGIELKLLYELADRIFRERQDVRIDVGSSLIMEDLYKVGTSAGGQRPKAIIAIDEATGAVRSGQADLSPNYTHCILKFDTGSERDFPYSSVEMAYYLMAVDCGIYMMPSRLVEIDGRQNFLTQRFDRVEGEKVHTQTLAAMSSLADSYEDLFVVGRRLGLSAAEQEQQYRRMVFNVLAANVDDHTKNFSFMMQKEGKWQLTPAYDLIFSVDPDSPFFRNHELTVLGKRNGITRSDLLLFAQRQDIRNAPNIVDEVAETVTNFRQYAERTGIGDLWTKKIWEVLKDNF